MAKQPIAWHEQCLGNRERVLFEDRSRLEALTRHIERSQQQVDFYRKQIRTAAERKMRGFDQDKFLVPKAGLKVYRCCYDGFKERIVAAKSMHEASVLTGISYSYFRVYGNETRNDESCRVALGSPGVVFEALVNSQIWQAVSPEKG